MKVLFFPILFLTSTVFSFAQISNVNDATGSPIRVGGYDKVEGSPYLNDGNWSSGVVVTQTDQFLSDLKIRYNAYEDELQYLNNGNPFFYENQDIKSFEFSVIDQLGNTERFFFKNGFEFEDDIEKKDFVRVLYDGKFIKALEKIESRKQLMTPAAYGESDYEKFVMTNETYIWINGELRESSFRKGKILKEIPSLKDEVKSYFKENTIDSSNSKDIYDLFQFLDKQLEEMDSL